VKLDQIKPDVVRQVLLQLRDIIETYDLSRHAAMKGAHGELANDPHWHRTIGKFLSLRCPDVERLSAPGETPVIWCNKLASRWGSVGDLGPQYDRDDPFTARMRLHQSWYRAKVLKVPHGRGPNPGSTKQLGNMLQCRDAVAGRNFLSPQIFDVAKRRVRKGSGAEPYRLLHNMLSSQPMCFNLFAPLVDDPELAAELVQVLWVPDLRRVLRVEIEWAPEPRSDYIDDHTSFDAFIEYELNSGDWGLIGVETKLTEPFSQKRYDKPSYRRWMTPDAPWRDDAGADVARVAWNQLWRNHLLVWSMIRRETSRYARGQCVVVRHPEDARCAEVIDGYRSLLKTTDTFEDCPLDRLLLTWRRKLGPCPWLSEFERRYLSLDLSRNLATRKSASVGSVTDKGPIRPRHRKAVELLEDTEAYCLTRRMYRDVIGRHGVYLRPTNRGLVAISLNYESDPAMMGVGRNNSEQHCLNCLPPAKDEVLIAYQGYLEKREAATRDSPEERFALRLLSTALNGDLSLPFPDVFFVHQEWRFTQRERLDILGVDPVRGQLVVVELKESEKAARRDDPKKGGDAWAQARRYAVRLFESRTDYYPFFERLARALARAHAAPKVLADITLDPDLEPRLEVLWPPHA
jgi:hypothetical protein